MNDRIRVRCAFLAAVACMSGVALAAPNTPIRSESTAARAVVIAFLQRGQLRSMMAPFNHEPRNIIDRALRSVRAVTTLQELAALPDGVVVDCAVSGTLTAKLARGWPRVVKFEWNACVSVDFGFTNTLTGPGEVTLLGNTLFAETVASIRLGNRTTDLVRDSQPPPVGFLGPKVETRNLRLTGIVPLARFEDDINSAFRGRFTYEAVGFLRSDEMRRDVGPGGPGTEFFPWTFETSTDGALLSGELTSDDTSSSDESRLVLGKISQRTDRPATPTFPEARTSTNWVRGTDYRIVLGRENAHDFWTIDGRLESNYSQAAGCAQPETFTYRTRSPLVAHQDTFYFNDLYDSGAISINGSTVASFSTTGSQPFVDMRGQLALEVPGVGSFNYDTGSSVPGALVLLSRCTP
jgi:hypothetical protein